MPAKSFRSNFASALFASSAFVAGFYLTAPARAQTVPPASPCNQISGSSGEIVTCSGDVSSGVDLQNGGGPYQVLNIEDLSANIAPATGVTGITFTSNGSVELNVTPGAFAIRATDADGIFAASNAGPVTVYSTADIFTSGGSATGVQVSGQNDLVSVISSGTITTSGNNAFGIAAGSIDGDAYVNSSGNISTSGTFAAGINVGTIGQSGTSFGAITIISTGDVTTSGNSAIGINAASVFGPIDITSLGKIVTSGSSSIGINAQTQGDVGAQSSGQIVTNGDGSVGISIETDGAAMLNAAGSIETFGDGASGIDVDGAAGAAVIATGNIRTHGDGSDGIAVVSTGDVAVASLGNITTTGNSSDGINVVGGGMVAVVNAGNISATGLGSAGIYAAGYTGTIVMNTGTVVGGACCAGVMMDSANFNTLLNWGTITAGLADFAVDMSGASNSVDNFGTITGDMILSDGADPEGSVINHAGGLLNSGQHIIAAHLLNDGTLSPGGRGVIEETLIGAPNAMPTVLAQFLQSGGGVTDIDIDGTPGGSDRIGVVGSADLAGKVAVNVIGLPILPQSYNIIFADQGVTNNGLGLIASPALHARLSYPSIFSVYLDVAVDFDVGGLNNNQRSLAGYLNRILGAGGGGVTPVLLGLLNVDDLTQYRSALDQLSPEIYSDAQIAALYSNLAFTGSLMSCKVNGTDTASIIREGQCLWAGASARFLDAGTTFQQIGFTESAGLFTAGAQVALDDVWRLGVAGGYQSSTISNGSGATSEGSLGQAGVAIKYNPGPLLLAGAVTGGGAQYDTRRTMAFGGFNGTAEGTQDLGMFSAGVRAAYVFGDPGLYLKPSIDANLTYLSLGGFTESGASGLGLSVNGQSETVFSLSPMVEAGTEFWLGNGTLVRPLLRGGLMWYDNADLALTASFADAPLLADGSVGGFTIHTQIDEVMGLVGAGLDVISGTDAVMRFSYDAQLGSTTQIHAIGIKGSAKF